MTKVNGFPGLICICLVAGCSNQAPVASFSQLDYEAVPEAGLVRHRFRLRNEGKAALEIRDVSTSCGCTVTTVGPTKINPGDISFIEASMQASRQRRKALIYVKTNDPTRAEVTLTLQASGPFPNEFEFVPNSMHVRVKTDEAAVLNCLLRFTAWRENGPTRREFVSPELSPAIEDLQVHPQAVRREDATKFFSFTRSTTNEHGWAKADFPDRTVWIRPVRLELRSQKPGRKVGVISAKLEGGECPNVALLVLGVDVR